MSHTPKSTTSTNTNLTDSQSNLTDSLTVSKTTSADCTQSQSQSVPCLETYSATYSESYFDALYSDNTDPWQYQTRWYEKRKRDICLAVLPQAQYDNAIELGCGNGVFSELLARRCKALVSTDGNNKAVQLAKQRLAGLPHVRVIQGAIPNALLTLKEALLTAYPLSDNPFSKKPLADEPFANKSLANKPPFDLIVISEILYYLSPNDINTVIAWIGQNLAIGGTLLCCHWRYAIDGFAMTGETVHQRLHQAFSLANNANNEGGHPVAFNHPTAFSHQSKIVDTNFLLDVWQNAPNSVAMQENLV
ncbi:class I SAM-dependent DNA methyltransferase [Psychrobacter sp. LV10R520-6]|uniref:class I SAM-dependent DNA methyltransferase n=1 Tax=Psychrobacter sp. LV10R520-6 TaxID=1415574 RepID=UPI0024C557B2|nr:class I SAM-dependent methyltransferase [Psychrobacter sp. LV10R520-6]SNT69632.1 Nodulation protein S (NodS) [Psychrobacter sp. LV10R520-6]